MKGKKVKRGGEDEEEQRKGLFNSPYSSSVPAAVPDREAAAFFFLSSALLPLCSSSPLLFLPSELFGDSSLQGESNTVANIQDLVLPDPPTHKNQFIVLSCLHC